MRIYRWLVSLIFGRCLLSHSELIELVKAGVINAPLENVKGTTIDLTLHHIIRREISNGIFKKVYLHKGETIETEAINLLEGGEGEYTLMPDAVMLGATVEYFKLPLNISAEFSLKSSLGRSFLGHELAGWIDAGFHGTITLELKNNTQFHKLVVAPGMPIGQVKFFRHRAVPKNKGYAAIGQYQGQSVATPSRGAK